MRILLLAPVHREREYFKEKSRSPFPNFQAQNSWVKAFIALRQRVWVFKYTDSILLPSNIKAHLIDFFVRFFPIWSARYFRIRDKFYFISLENFLQNRKLLNMAKKSKPNLVIVSGGIPNIYPSTIKSIKETYGSKVLLFSGVNPDIAATRAEKIMVCSGIIDIVVENDRGYAKRWEKVGAKKTIVLPISSVDRRIHKKIKLSKKDYAELISDFCFVGTLTEDRQEMLKSIRQAQKKQIQYRLKIWGDIPPGLKLRRELEPYYHGKAFGEKMVKIFNAAKIVLNFQPRDMTHGGNMRTFEIPGCGAFELADRIDSKFLVDGRNFVSFKDVTDLRNKIQYYLQNTNKRLKITQEGFRKVYRDHTYEKHFRILLDRIQK